MKPSLARIKPVRGFTYLFHIALLVLLPLVVFVLILDQFVIQAFIVILLSKWRIFAVRPRFWPAGIRANSVDIIVGVSLLAFMVHSGGHTWLQLMWAILYGVWLIFIKPATGIVMVSVQAMIAQLCALTALFLVWGDRPLYILVFSAGLICYFCARHFFDSYDEPYTKLLAYVWGYFGAALVWLLGHWLLFYYHILAQPTLLISTIGYGLATLYFLDHKNKLSIGLRRQFIFIMLAIIVVVLTFSDWGGKVV
jgi:hypothetical protein